ncbi:MAG: CusA/CzcA family heavy metal efflux RND transporter [Pseudomonadota bacterium]
MIDALIRIALGQRLLVALVAVALMVTGVWAYRSLPIDAFPDISSPQVMVVVKAPGLAPTEVESRITAPLEIELQGMPRQTVLRSTTKYALTNIIVDFEDGTDIYWARNQVNERLNQARASLPPGITPELAPITTPLGEIYMYRLSGPLTNAELRTLQDWVVRPRLRGVEGVADVNSLGGEVRAYEVVARPDALRAHGLAMHDLERALQDNNRNAGGDRIERDNAIFLVRTLGQVRGADDIANIAVITRAGQPVRVRDVARVRTGALTRYGAVTAHGEGEAVTGLVLLRKGANSRSTVEGVKRELSALAPSLPPGVTIAPFYDRAELVDGAIHTVRDALGEAVALVILVLVVLLGNLRAALTVAVILPLSVVFTLVMMRVFGVAANLMSLGGLTIAIGLLVDAAVVIVENIHARMHESAKGADKLHLIYRAAAEVATPVLAGIIIIILVFLPLFSLTGLEGKMFAPLAVTIAFALSGSLLMSLTVIPVLASVTLRAQGGHDSALLSALKRLYTPILRWSLRRRGWPLSMAVVALAAALVLYPRIGSEFMPTMDEGTTVVIIEKNSNITLDGSLAMDKPLQRAMMELPEVTGVVSRTGADELRLDPMGLYQTDNFLVTKPRAEWTTTVEDFNRRLREKLAAFKHLELDIAYTQPIDMRASEMLTGVRAAIAVKLFGDDLAVLEEKSHAIEKAITGIPGATDVFRGRLAGQNYLEIVIRQDALAHFGVSVEAVNRLVESAVGGIVVTEVIAGARRVPVLVRYPRAARSTSADLAALLVETPGGAMVPLGQLADIRSVDGPVAITREGAKRLITVQANVVGRDIVGFVAEVRAALAHEVILPPGYYLAYGGQFENQQRAAARLGIVVPIALGLILLILFSTFGTLRHAGLIFLNIPFALIGGVVALYLSGFYLSVPASVGFIALFGIAVLNGVVLVSHFNELRQRGLEVYQAVEEGALRRLRPVLMTALIAALGLIPMLLASGPGSELQRPLAVVVIGGLISSTLLTLVLLPTLYAWLEGRVRE